MKIIKIVFLFLFFNFIRTFAQVELNTGFECDNVFFYDDVSVVSASLVEESKKTAPSMITVLTKDRISQLGYKTLHELLYFITGINPSRFLMGGVQINIRGVSGVKIMIDGHDVFDYVMNARFFVWPEIGLENIEKIEIMRGAGSCLYGANAFGGVINIISKQTDKSQKKIVDFSSSVGSYGLYQLNAGLFNESKFGNIRFYLDLYGYNGSNDLTLERDLIYWHPASLTPDTLNEEMERKGFRLVWEKNNFTADINYTNAKGDPLVGIHQILNHDSARDETNFYTDLKYDQKLSNDSEISYRVSFDRNNSIWDSMIYPRDFVIPYDLDGDNRIEYFPYGASIKADWVIDKYYAESIWNEKISDNLTLISGIFLQQIKLFDVKAKSNFNLLTSAYFDSPDLIDVTQTMAPFRENKRNLYGLFSESIYKLNENINITLGARYDHYSDFGDSFNPRIACIYLIDKENSIKLIYGKAFNAPDFSQMYAINNPVAIGNPNLKAEVLNDIELAFDLTPYEKMDTLVTFFYNKIDNMIETGNNLVPIGSTGIYAFNFDNVNSAKSYGTEIELSYIINDIIKPYFNYAYTKSYDVENGYDLLNTPRHKFNTGFNYSLGSFGVWRLNGFYSGKIESATSSSTDSFLVVDTNYNFPFFKGFEAIIGIKNLFDKKYYQPSGTTSLSSFQMPPRSIWFKLRKKFL